MSWLNAAGTTKIRQGTLAVWLVVLLWGFHYVVLYRPLRLINPEIYLIVRFTWASGLVLLMCLFFPFWRGSRSLSMVYIANPGKSCEMFPML